MSFYTSLTGLNAATAQLGVTSNNIANVSTTGFKRSRTDFGDIFATSPLQKASATIGQGVSLKRVVQEFGQGNMIFSSNTLDLAISGDGFFPLKSQDGFQDIFTRNGVFMMNDQYNVVNSAGQKLMAASVDSSGKANLDDMNVLTIPQKTTGMAKQTSKVQLGLNFPADAEVITKDFNRNDPESYNKSTALTVYDAGGNSYLASVYYVKTQNASQESPNNKWQTYVYVGDKLVSASLQQATNTTGELMYVNKYGELRAKSDFKTPEEIAELNSSFSKKTIKFSLDDLTDIRTSQPATVVAGLATDLGTGSNDGIDFGNYLNVSKSDLLRQQGSSSMTFAVDSTSGGSREITFGPEGARVTVTVSPVGTTPPTIDQVVSDLNSNANFTSYYVAQTAYTEARISSISLGNNPASNPLSNFIVDLGGKQYDISLDSTLDNLEDIAADIQTKLRVAADGSAAVENITVTSSGAGLLQINDAAERNIKGIELVKLSNAAAAVSTGLAPVYDSPVLKITAIDPNVSAADMNSDKTGLVVKQNNITLSSTASPATAAMHETAYTRAKVTYTLGTGPTVKATFGSASAPLTEEASTGSELVDKLNKNATFSADFIASISGSTLTVKARDPIKSSATTISDNVKVFQNTTGATETFAALAGTDTDGKAALVDGTKRSVDDLKNLFKVNVDNSIEGVTVGLDHLLESMADLPSTASKKLSGAQIAAELTNVIQRAYGDEKPFNFSTIEAPTFKITLAKSNGTTLSELPIDLSAAGDMRHEDLVRTVQHQINENGQYSGLIDVSYDTQLQKLMFTPKDNSKVTVSSERTAIGLADPLVQGVNDQSVGLSISPSVSTGAFRASNDQRYGMKVEYDGVKQTFVFKSGSTGDGSSIGISDIRPGSLSTQTAKGLGLTGDPTTYVVTPSTVDALRGVSSKPAVLTGNAMAVNVDNNFSVDATNNQFVVSVNGITGTVTIPPKDTYTLGTFMEALQHGINSLQSTSKNGLTPQSANGVKVSYDAKLNALTFTTGTASTDSYIKVTGEARWGLDGLDAKFGTTTTWIKPKAFTDEKGATVYIDGFGSETSSAADFDTLPSWSPIYFDKGELTFDTAGNLVSPKQGAQLDTVYLPNGKGALTINIDYSKSTQFASPFAVLSQSQDGAPEGDLVGLAIKDDGLVAASYSNGAQKSLAKVVLVNFSNPTGLRQIGDTNYYKTSESGTPKYGEAGSAGFGTVRSGATERANVDLTQELVDLITEQRNFQANAKAMETSTSMTQTIIQIRN
jgi:flagellar hook-basal body protein